MVLNKEILLDTLITCKQARIQAIELQILLDSRCGLDTENLEFQLELENIELGILSTKEQTK